MSAPNVYRCPYCSKQVRGQRDYVDHLVCERTPHGGITTGEIMDAGAGERFGARVHEINKIRDYRIESFYSSPGNFRYIVVEEAHGAEGGGAQPERAPAQRSSSGTARAATLNAAGPSRWVCFATRECMSAGPLDGRVCPRGSDHPTQSVIYVDLARSDDQEERLAA